MTIIRTEAEAAAFIERFEFRDAVIHSVQLKCQPEDECLIQINCREVVSGEWLGLCIRLEQLGAFCFSQPAATAWYIISNDLTVLVENNLIYLDLGGLDEPKSVAEILNSTFFCSGRVMTYTVVEYME